MKERVESPSQYAWIVYAVAMLGVGGLAGYILANTSSRQSANYSRPVPAVQSAVSSPQSQTFAEAVDAGNKLYDAQKYDDAIPYYRRALALSGNDIDVSTDLGTALWYTGRPDEALAQYDRSLALDRAHAQTLFNVGVVRADGKHDYAGAIDAWESLLKVHPDYANADKVRSLIDGAKTKLSSSSQF
jgi:tetratricopeptide (TPR) repeat protein